MKFIYRILLVLAVSFVSFSCIKEKEVPVLEEGEGWLVMNFGADRDIDIETRSTLNEKVEKKIFNLYVFVFDASGNKLFAKWYDASSLKSDAEVLASVDDCWSVDNSASPVNGRIKLHTTAGTGYKLYALSNIDADMINVSNEKLGSVIQTENDLLNFKADLNQNTIARNGYFPMSGKVSDVAITATNISSPNLPLKLSRIDAKVRFIFRADKVHADTAGQHIERFIPISWRVVNVPKSIYVMDYDVRGIHETSGSDAGTSYAQFFKSEFVNFEEFPSSDESQFSFYMLENRRTPKVAPMDYQQRSKQTKNADGTNLKNADGSLNFAYADDWATYVEVKGKIEMQLVNDDAGRILHADVKYIIHLGDFQSSVSDYNVKRNHSYTYIVNVVSPNSIRVEVETSDRENQPGAVGNVTVAKEEIAICDAHYVNKTMTFRAKDITDDLTWYVKTPFCDGGPTIINGNDVVIGLDYKWVKFRLNEKDGLGKYFEEKRRDYTPAPFVMNADGTHNDGVMDISQLVRFLKEQKRKFDISPTASVFDKTTDANGGPKIRVTAFIDEFYYEKDPITGKTSTGLWKKFVNQGDRFMHILSDSKFSKDKESRMTGSVVTIEQKPIGTFFNVDMKETSLRTAWGLERIDEYLSENWSDGTPWKYAENTEDHNNTDLKNGRLNTAKEWGLCYPNSTDFIVGHRWDTYLKNTVPNDVPQLRESYRYHRYACMTRNRDNNGNGIIDKDEVRWYMASIRQLAGLWIGVDALDHNAKMYNRTPEQRNSSDQNQWRQHVISSTKEGKYSDNPAVIWAEEGASIGPLSGSMSWAGVTDFTVRCVRDLGMDSQYNLDQTPQAYVEVKDNPDGTKLVKNTYLNKACIRYFTSRDLDEGSELSEENKVYWQFSVAPENSLAFEDAFVTINENITNSNTGNPYCPAGYRLPNQRELSLIYFTGNITGLSLPTMPTRTYWSMGTIGRNPYREDKNYFGKNEGTLFLASPGQKATGIRCVRDVRVP